MHLKEYDYATLYRAAANMLANNIDWISEGETIFLMVKDTVHGVTETDFEADNSAWQEAFREWMTDRISEKHSDIMHHFKNGVLRIWREITAHEGWVPDERHPGLFWSWDKSAAEAHWGGAGVKYLLCCEVKVSAIDWPTTLALNASSDYESECEIRIKDRPVKLLSVERRK